MPQKYPDPRLEGFPLNWISPEAGIVSYYQGTCAFTLPQRHQDGTKVIICSETDAVVVHPAGAERGQFEQIMNYDRLTRYLRAYYKAS